MQYNHSIPQNRIYGEPEVYEAGIWHYIRTFCAFFAILPTICFIGMFPFNRSAVIPYLFVLWGLGAIAGLLVAPVPLFFFGSTIMRTMCTYAWFLLPFPADLLPVMFAIPLSAMLILAFITIIPCAFTIYVYFDEIRFESTNAHKERTAVFAGIAAAVLLFASFVVLTGIGKEAEAPVMEDAFEPYRIYEAYMEDYGREVVYTEASLAKPLSVEEKENGYNRRCFYRFEQYDENLYSAYDVEIVFDWNGEEWRIKSLAETVTPLSFTSVSGTWCAVGKYPTNLSYNNGYTCNLTFTPEGGSGTIDVSCGAVSYHLDIVSIEMGELRYADSTYAYEQEYGCLQDMKLVFSEPMNGTSWGTEYYYTDIECVYSFETNTLSFHTFSPRMTLEPQTEPQE